MPRGCRNPPSLASGSCQPQSARSVLCGTKDDPTNFDDTVTKYLTSFSNPPTMEQTSPKALRRIRYEERGRTPVGATRSIGCPWRFRRQTQHGPETEGFLNVRGPHGEARTQPLQTHIKFSDRLALRHRPLAIKANTCAQTRGRTSRITGTSCRGSSFQKPHPMFEMRFLAT